MSKVPDKKSVNKTQTHDQDQSQDLDQSQDQSQDQNSFKNNIIIDNNSNFFRCKSRKDLYKQIYRVIYIANIKKMIDETKYIDVLQKLSMAGFKTYHIDDFDKLTIHLQSIGLNNSFNISILMHLRDTNYKKISDVAILFSEIGEIFSLKKRKMVDRMQSIRKILKHKLNLIKVFKKIEKISNFSIMDSSNSSDQMNAIMVNIHTNLSDDLSDDSSVHISDNKKNKKKPLLNKFKLSKHKIESEFRYYTKLDIINRLHLLAETHFTLNQLQFMNVELKYLSEIEQMSNIDLELYYFDVLDRIDKSLKAWMTICRMYIDIEINYIECCDNIINGNNTKLDLKHFSIDIKNNITMDT
jgi:hypothetical protein